MSLPRKLFRLCLTALCLAAALPPAAAMAAGNWPSRTIKIVVPYSAGGSADLIARTMAPGIGKQLGVSVVVENAPGGAGAIGMAKLAASKPDGYTLVFTTIGPATLSPNWADVGYTNKEFAPIAQVADVPTYIAVHRDSGIKTMAELLEKAEKEKNFTYGTIGAGLIQNVQMESLLLFLKKPGLMTHIPFDGASQVIAALLGKQVTVGMTTVTEMLPHIQNGSFVALATTNSKRDKALPDVPAFPDLGFPGYGGTWFGFAAPAKTPVSVIERLSAVIKQESERPETAATFAKLGNPVQFLDNKAFTEKWMRTFEANKATIAEMKKHSKK